MRVRSYTIRSKDLLLVNRIGGLSDDENGHSAGRFWGLGMALMRTA